MTRDSEIDLDFFYRRFTDGEEVRIYQSVEDTENGYTVIGINEDGEGFAFETGQVGWVVFEKNGYYAVRMHGIDDDYFYFSERSLVGNRKGI